MKKMCICFHVFFKSSVGFLLSNRLNAKKKYIWNAKYRIQRRIKGSQTIKCIQYNKHDTKSYELPKYYVRKSFHNDIFDHPIQWEKFTDFSLNVFSEKFLLFRRVINYIKNYNIL